MAARAERGFCRVERSVVILIPRTLSSTTASCSLVATLGPYMVLRAPAAAYNLAPAASISITSRSRPTLSSMSELAIDRPNESKSWASASVKETPLSLVMMGAVVVWAECTLSTDRPQRERLYSLPMPRTGRPLQISNISCPVLKMQRPDVSRELVSKPLLPTQAPHVSLNLRIWPTYQGQRFHLMGLPGSLPVALPLLSIEQKRLCGKGLLAPRTATPGHNRVAPIKAVVVVPLARFHPNEGCRVRFALNARRF